jgi:hypothetical protein
VTEDTGTEYDVLPASIKQVVSYREWLWMTDLQKSQLVRYETEPEWNEP